MSSAYALDPEMRHDARQPGFRAHVWRILVRPTWKTLPVAWAIVAMAAAVPAPAVAHFMAWLLGFNWNDIYKDPSSLGRLARAGAICQALGAYTFGILPLEFVRPKLRRYPVVLTYTVAIAGAMLGATAGTRLAFSSVVSDMLGGAATMRVLPPMNRITALSFMITITAAAFAVIVRTIFTEAENRERVLSEAAALAKAHALQSQINPHFFFNTLTTISALADLDSNAAKDLVGRLAELFRYTLSCSRFEMVSLADELEFVSNYLRIEQARFRRRLRFEVPAPGSGSDVLLPGLTLQPLVENAIRHGIAKRRQGGIVRISIQRNEHQDGSVCTVSVANQIATDEGCPPLNTDEVFRPGHALANTRDRLELAFDGRAKLTFVTSDGEWFEVLLTIPATRAPQ